MKFIKDVIADNLWFKIFSIVAVCLIVSSFIVPPTGVIDSSVLAAAGELAGFAAIGTVIKAIDKGVGATIAKGDMSIDIKHDEK